MADGLRLPTEISGSVTQLVIGGALFALGLALSNARRLVALARSGWEWGYAIFTGASKFKTAQDEHERRISELEAVVSRVYEEIAPKSGQSTRALLKQACESMEGTRAALDQLNAQVTIIVDEMDGARFHCGVDGACIMANHELCSLFGRSVQDMMGNSWLEAVHHGDRERVYMKWHASVTRDIPWEDVYRIVVAGVERTVHAKAKAVRAVDGRIVMYAGTIHPLPAA